MDSHWRRHGSRYLTSRNNNMAKMRHKQYIGSILMATAFLAAGCNSYPELIYESDNNNENNEQLYKIPIMLFVNEQEYFSINSSRALTRGTGAFEESNTEKYNNATFYVFAFRDEESGQTTLTSAPDLTKTAYSSSNAAGRDTLNESCLIDGTSRILGMPFVCNPDRAGALELKQPVTINGTSESSLYYSNTYQDVGYNFFGYYIDDFKPTSSNTHRTASSIYYDLHIDGSQDILLGSAPRITSELINDEYSSLKLSTEDRNRIIQIGSYSTFSGHRQLHPVIRMEHKLARLVFKAFPGDESADRVTITGISIVTKSRGKLVVAGRTADDCQLTFNNGSEEELVLREASPDGVSTCPELKSEGYVVNWDESMADTPWADRPSTQIGSCLLLPQSESYTLLLSYTYHAANGKDIPLKAKYQINAPQNDGVSYDADTKKYYFRAGYQYNVKIAVYGLQEIKVAATVEGWQSSDEDIIVDPDNEIFE